MLNVKNVVGLNKALEFNEYDTTVEFVINSDINCTYKVFCNHDDKCYKLTVKDVLNCVTTVYTYRHFSDIEEVLLQQLN